MAVPDTDPFRLFLRWYDEITAAGQCLPDAMALATSTPDGVPSVRFVLYKGWSQGGLRFFTHYPSRKGRELDANPRAALAFHHPALERQIRLEGRVERLPARENEEYFASRPRGSQLGAWASDQSEPVESEAALDQAMRDAERRFGDGAVPLPPHWGGYRLMPSSFEFWEGRPNRMHERILFTRQADGSWLRSILAP